MNTPQNDGGPAFPQDAYLLDPNSTHDDIKASKGMTLRDWFAGQALAGFVGQWEKEIGEAGIDEISNEKLRERERAEWIQRAANTSYGYADAMLAARNERQEP